MKHLISFSLILLSPMLLSAQVNIEPGVGSGSVLSGGYGYSVRDAYNAQRIKDEFLNGMIKETTIDIKDVKGSPYLNDIFLPGVITDNLTGKNADVFLRYNVYSDIFEVKYDLNSEEVFGFIQRPGLDCVINSTKYYYTSFKDENNVSKLGYLQEILSINNRLKLLKRNYQKLHLPKEAKTSLERDVPAKLTNHESYYLFLNNQMYLISTKKNKTHKSFPSHQDVIKAFIKEKKLNPTIAKDLVQIIEFYHLQL